MQNQRSLLGFALLLALALGLEAPTVHAQSDELVPPALAEPAEASVEREAFGEREEVAVVLEIDVEASGAVADVRVVEPAGEPFDAAALEAARRFVFNPARRGEEPIPARIRFRFVLRRPPDQVDDAPDQVDAPDQIDAPRAPDTADDATPVPIDGPTTEDDADTPLDPATVIPEFGAVAEVAAPEREVQRLSIDRAHVSQIAGAHNDPIRATELLPGVSVTPYNASASGLVVRGSHPLDTQVMIEGAPSPILNHVGGYTSFFNGRLLDQVTLYPGNYSARFGRALGAVVDVTVRDEFADGFHGGADVNIIDASVFAEGSAPDLHAAVAARRSWVDAIYGAVLGDDHLVSAPVYYDYQGILRYRAGSDDELRLLVYGSHDNVALDYANPGRDPRIQGDIHNLTQFHRGQIEWRHRYSRDVRHDIRLMAGYLNYDQQVGGLLAVTDEGVELNGRGELTMNLDERATLMLGFDFWGHDLNATYSGPPAPAPEGDPLGFGFDDPQVQTGTNSFIGRNALYAEARLTPVDGWTLIPGFRLDYMGDIDAWSPEPRLSSLIDVTDTTQLRVGVGLFAQPPQLGRTFEGFGNPALDPERAVHTTLGVRQDIADVVRVSLDGYYKHYFDRIVATADGSAPYLINDGEGRAYGGELSARWIGDRHFTGYLSYTLQRSERSDRGGPWRLFDYDQTHIATVALAYDFGDGWEAGATFRLISGTPYTPITGATYDATSDRYVPRYGLVNSVRNELWHRLDLRIAKTFVIDGTGRIQISLDVMNVTNYMAQDGRNYAYDYRESVPSTGLPIIPNLGIRGEL